MRTPARLLVSVALAVIALPALAGGAVPANAALRAPILDRIHDYRAETWRWERLMGVRLTPATGSAERSPSREYRRWVLGYWQERAARARARAQNPPRYRAWMCIHRREGPWNANTGNGYYGGLQMDMAFQRRHGLDLLRTRGTANRWRPLEQIWVAERAHRSGLGFRPWPNTARACGLL
jgi:Transglycosylase-like domain